MSLYTEVEAVFFIYFFNIDKKIKVWIHVC